MLGMTPLLLAGGLALSAGSLPAAVFAQEAEGASPQAAATAGPQRIEMTVLGLSCPFCAYGLEKKLKKVEGLVHVDIDFKTGKVKMEVKDGSKVTDERLKQLVKDAGFELREIIRSAVSEPSGIGEGRAR